MLCQTCSVPYYLRVHRQIYLSEQQFSFRICKNGNNNTYFAQLLWTLNENVFKYVAYKRSVNYSSCYCLNLRNWFSKSFDLCMWNDFEFICTCCCCDCFFPCDNIPYPLYLNYKLFLELIYVWKWRIDLREAVISIQTVKQ